MPAANLIGTRFGRLTVRARAGTNPDRKALWECACDCGGAKTTTGKALRLGQAKSCGCLQKERASQASRLDLLGHTYGRLTVIAAAGTGGSGRRLHSLWQCRCECGNELVVPANDLRTGNTSSCGCLKAELLSARSSAQLQGQVFGRLTVLERTENNRHGQACWRCRCECGKELVVNSGRLLQATTRSCGCLQRDRASKATTQKLEGRVFGRLTVLSRAGSLANKSLWLCSCSCGNSCSILGNNLITGNSTSCGCVHSQPEKDILALVRSWLPGEEVIGNRGLVDGAFRYDVFIPSRKIAIEFNGVYWHTIQYKPKDYHLLKRRVAEQEGYRLISVWEDDWNSRQEQVSALLRRVLDLDPLRSIGARKLQIRTISPATANAHHQAYHMQGGMVRGTLHFGAYHEGELIAVASFRQEGRADHAIIARYTVRPGYTLPGFLAKLLKLIPFDRITSYCDRDYFDGSIYGNAGFTLAGTTLQLRYSDGKQRHHRERYMRHRLPALGIEPLPGESASAALARHGIQECWNSGIDRWVWGQLTPTRERG